MTLDYLQAYFDIREQLKMEQELIDRLWATAYPGAQKLDGMPHSHDVKDKVGDLAVEICALEERHELTKEKAKEMEKNITEFLSGIDDSDLCLMFRLRYIHAMMWKEVAAMLNTSEVAAKSACYRYLSNH
ncbi:MAG: hypothetical protein ACI3VY_02015 [Faecousia sp.]